VLSFEKLYHPNPAALKREVLPALAGRYAGFAIANRGRVSVGSNLGWKRRQGCEYNKNYCDLG